MILFKEVLAMRRIFSLADMISDTNMPFTHVVNVCSDMSLSKGHLGSRGEEKASKYKL